MLVSGCSVFHASVTKRYQEALAAGPYDALIVPGFPSKNGKWHRVVKARVYWSRHLYTNGVARHIIYSGNAVYTPYRESTLMALYAEAIGVPPEAIVLETEAEHSCENLYFSYRLGRELGFEKMAVVSDPIQTSRLRKVAREFDLPVAFLPVDFVTYGGLAKTNPVIDSRAAFVEDFVPISKRYTWKQLRAHSRGSRIREDRER